MRLTSKWNGGPVFVRVFGPTDTIYVFGRWETTLKFGESVDFNLPEGQLQLEIKQGGLFGPFIVRPGQIWQNGDERVLNDKGELVVPDAASSGATFSDVGSPYDPASGQFKLVGGGRVTTPIDTEFFITVDGTFQGPVQ